MTNKQILLQWLALEKRYLNPTKVISKINIKDTFCTQLMGEFKEALSDTLTLLVETTLRGWPTYYLHDHNTWWLTHQPNEQAIWFYNLVTCPKWTVECHMWGWVKRKFCLYKEDRWPVKCNMWGWVDRAIVLCVQWGWVNRLLSVVQRDWVDC